MGREKFAERLRSRMSALRISIRVLADTLGVQPSQVQRWRDGRIPRKDALYALASALDMTPDALCPPSTGSSGKFSVRQAPLMDREKFRIRLNEAMRFKGWSQPRAAREIGVSAAAVQGWTAGKGAPQPKNLKKVADALGVSVGWLTGEEEDPEPDLTVSTNAVLAEIVANIKRIETRMYASEIRAERRAARARQAGPATWIPIDPTGLDRSAAGIGQTMVQYLSAGLGSDVEPADDNLHAPEFAGDNVVLARVHGASMEPTIPNGSVVVLELATPPMRLPSVEEIGRHPIAKFRSRVPHGCVAVCSVDDGAPTLKRVLYIEASPEHDATWIISLSADNEDWAQGTDYERGHWVTASESLTIHARVVAMGVLEEDAS